MGNNSDFTSELLRINGLLQTSITELRYRCEVYRLSLRTICKTLVNVQKEQEGRLRCLTTIRPSYQAYLLNLSQKQALDRIGNVVRKASTFINGYSLVDKRLFQPPPPKPSSVQRNKKKVAFATTTPSESAKTLSKDPDNSPSLKKENVRENSSLLHGNGKVESVTASAQKKRIICTRSEKRKGGGKGKNSKPSTSSPSLVHPGMDERKRNKTRSVGKRRNGNGKGEHNRKSLRLSSLKGKREEKQTKVSSKSITCQRLQVINPLTRYQDNSANRKSPLAEHRRAGLEKSRSGQNHNPSKGKTSAYHVNKDTWRAEVRRRPSKEQNTCRRESSSRRTDRLDERNANSSIRSARLKEMKGSRTTAKTTRYKVRESLALVRHRPQDSNANQSSTRTQGKYLFSAQRTQRNSKRNSTIVEQMRRPVLNRGAEDAKRKAHSSVQCESKKRSSITAPRSLFSL